MKENIQKLKKIALINYAEKLKQLEKIVKIKEKTRENGRQKNQTN